MKVNNKLNNKSILKAGTNETINITANVEKKINLNTEFAKIGNKFSLSNGSLVIGSGVNYTLIGAQLTFSGSSKGCAIKLFKNGTLVAHSLLNSSSSDIQPTLNITPMLLSVEEGDIIEFYVLNGVTLNATANQIFTYVNIQEV